MVTKYFHIIGLFLLLLLGFPRCVSREGFPDTDDCVNLRQQQKEELKANMALCAIVAGSSISDNSKQAFCLVALFGPTVFGDGQCPEPSIRW